MQTYSENIQRFWERVWFDDDCWPWCGPRNGRGYGLWNFHGKTRKASRIMWEIFNGQIPKGLGVLHECDNPCCVNIGHLFLGTQTDNMRDCAAKNRNYVPELKGEQHGGSKITEKIVRTIVSLENVHSHAKLGKMFNISRSVVTRIFHGILWRHVTGRVPKEIPKTGRRIGINHPSAKLTEDQVREIRKRLSEGQSQYSLEKVYKINRRSIWEIAHRKSWAHVQ